MAKMTDLIDRQAAIDAICGLTCDTREGCELHPCIEVRQLINLPSAQPTQTNTPNALESLDCVSRQAAIDAIKTWGLIDGLSEGQAIEILADEEKLPTAQPEIIQCKDCKWWGYKDDTSLTRMCHAAKHEYLTKHWEIYIHRRHKGEFYCADAERRTE